MKPNSTLRALLALAGSSLITISSASAQATSATWDQNSDGNWTDILNWTGDTAYAGGADNTATFGNFIGANRVITLNAGITIGNITASDTSHNYTISPSTTEILTLDVTTGIPVIDVTTAGRTLTINSQISGTDGLQKSGAGILQLSSTLNNYTGGTTINAGTLSVAVDANLGDAAGSITLNGGELSFNTGTNFSSAREVILNNVSGNQILLKGNLNWINSGAFTGDGGVNFKENPNGNVSATLTSTSNTFKGALGIESTSGGTIAVNIRSLADSAEANGNIIFGNGTSSQTFEWSTAAASGLTLNYRSIELTGDANNTATIRNNNTTQVLTINTDLVYTTGTGAKTIGLDITGAGAGIVINGDISDGTGGGTVAVQKQNNGGPLSLLGSNSYTGQTQLLNGTTTVNTLADFGSNSSIGKGTTGVAVLFAINSSSATLNYTGGTTSSNRTIQINSANNNNGGGATINNNGSGKLTFTATTFNQTYSTATAATRGLTLGGSNDGEIQGIIQDSNSFVLTSLTKNNAGTWTLSGANTYTGNTAVSGGTLKFAKQTSLYNNDTANWIKTKITVNSGGTLAFNVGGTGEFTTSDVTTLLGGLGGAVNNNGLRSGSFIGFDTTNASGGTFTVGDVIANTSGTGGGAVGLTKFGTGTLVLTNTNTYTGATSVNAGKLLVNGSIANSTTTVASGATLGGTGTISGAVNVTGQLSPGASIETLATGALSMLDTSTLVHELDSSVADGVGSDLLRVTGNLSLTGTVNLTLADLAVTDVAFQVNDTFSLINYTGTWNGGLFTLSGNELSDEEVFTFGLNTWMISYNDATGGLNYTGEYAGGTDSFVNITALTVIPEPKAALLGALGVLLLLRRRR